MACGRRCGAAGALLLEVRVRHRPPSLGLGGDSAGMPPERGGDGRYYRYGISMRLKLTGGIGTCVSTWPSSPFWVMVAGI